MFFKNCILVIRLKNLFPAYIADKRNYDLNVVEELHTPYASVEQSSGPSDRQSNGF
jgi:hypothetical protein